MKSNIALIGFMGSGKTTTAKFLSSELKKKYVSTDEIIENKMKKSIEKIFKENGEIRFRELEIEAIKKVSEMEDTIIDCGGGIVLNRINIDHLKKNSHIILLEASPEVIIERLSREGKRPLLKVKDKENEIKKLLKIRKPLYENSGDYKINTSNIPVNQVGRNIINYMSGLNEHKNKKK